MSHKRFCLFIFSFFILLFLTSCTNLLKVDGEFNFIIPENRTAGNTSSSFTLFLYNKNGVLYKNFGDIVLNEEKRVSGIPVGEYIVKVIGEDDFYTYFGESEVTINIGECTPLKLELQQKEKDFISLSSTTEGIKIQLKNMPEGTTTIEIVRKSIKTGKQTLIDFPYNEKNQISEVTDYFVNSGDKYEYILTFGRWTEINGAEWHKTIDPIEVVSDKGGIGELTYGTLPSATYNESNAIMSFTILPKLSTELENFITAKNGKVYYNAIYNSTLEVQNFDVDLVIPIEEEVSCTERVDKNAYNKELKFIGTDMHVYFGEVRYYSDFLGTPVMSGMPQTLKVNPSGPEVVATNDGINIKISNVPTGTNHIELVRENINTGKKAMVDVTNYDSNKMTEVTDYFVTKGNKYKYTITFRRWTEANGLEWNRTMGSTEVVSDKGGHGELAYGTLPVAEYNNETTVMNFTTMPALTSELNDFVQSQNGSVYNTALYGSKTNEGYKNIKIILPIEDKYISCTYEIAKDSYNKDINFLGTELFVWFGDVRYYRDFTEETAMPGMPKQINVKEINLSLTSDAGTGGVKINLPACVQNLSDYDCTITRIEVGNREKAGHITVNSTSLKGNTYVLDPFVNTGTEYEYSISISRKKTEGINEVYEPVLFNIAATCTANSGVGELKLKTTTASYIANTGIISFNPIPEIVINDSSLSDKIQNKSVMFYYGMVNKAEVCCNAYLKDNGEVNLAEALKTSLPDYSGEEFTYRTLDINVKIDGYTHSINYSKNGVNGMINNIPDNIIITIPTA